VGAVGRERLVRRYETAGRDSDEVMTNDNVVVFDLGGVVVDWNPRYLYRKLFSGNEKAMEDFLATVCTTAWNEEQDAGRTFAEAGDLLKEIHPDKGELIDAWFARYGEMFSGEIPGTVEILRELRSRGVPVYALSNWSAETFPIAVKRFECLGWFKGVLLSGEVKLLKPDRRIFETFLERFSIEPSRAIYIDDRSENVAAAGELGMRGVVFSNSGALRTELTRAGLLAD
jgi:2-haloacid dehalogenase